MSKGVHVHPRVAAFVELDFANMQVREKSSIRAYVFCRRGGCTCTPCTPMSGDMPQAGRCACGQRVVRGPDDTGELVVIEPTGVDAAAELHAWASSRQSFTLDWRMRHPIGFVIARRSTTQLKRWPAGTTAKRVVLAHDCPLTRRDDQ